MSSQRAAFEAWWSNRLTSVYDPKAAANEAWQACLRQPSAKCDALQAKIDALMWEYCPEEMTEAQISEWARHQRLAFEPPPGAGK